MKAHRYQRNIDDIVTTDLSQKAQRDLYTAAVHGVALRTLHEVFEADRDGHVRSMSLRVLTEAPNPATGITDAIALVEVAAERESFNRMDLAQVVPLESLKHLGAALSSNPHALRPIADGTRVSRAGQR